VLRIGMGFAGWGTISKTHVIALKSMEIMFQDLRVKPKILGLCTRGEKAPLEDFKYVSKDLGDLLNKKDIEAVDVCTPNFLHLDQGKAVIKAGKHLYMEKPLARNLGECKELVDLCNRTNIINQTALMYRFLPAVVMARDYIRSGGLGQILNFRALLYHGSYLNSERPISWRLQGSMAGGGALLDLGIHLADTIRFVLGEAREVRAKTHTHFRERYTDNTKTDKMMADVDEWALLNITMEDGAHGTLEVSRINADIFEETIIDIYGTKGKLTINTNHPGFPQIYNH